LDKPREIEAKVGRLRPVGREIYDRRAATAIPGATGGRPSTGSGVLAAATGEEVAPISAMPVGQPRPLGDINDLVKNGQLRYAQRPQGILGSIPRLNRKLEDYTINNADLVNITASYLDQAAVDDPKVLDGFSDSFEAAQWAVAQIQRNFEPGTAPPMVDLIHQSRAGRRVYQWLRQIEEAHNAGA
jgi:hypothetical protein